MRRMVTDEELDSLIPDMWAHNIVVKCTDGTTTVQIYFNIYSHQETIYSLDNLEMLFDLMKGAAIEHNNTYMSKREAGFVKSTHFDTKTIYFYNIVDNDPDDYVGLNLSGFTWIVFDNKHRL